MKNEKFKIVRILGVIIFLLIWQILMIDRMDQIRSSGNVRIDEVEQSLSKDIEKLEIESIDDRLRSLESNIEWVQEARILDLERKTERLEDILLAVDEIDTAHGTIVEMIYDGEWRMEIEFEEEIDKFTVSDQAKAYFIDTIGLTEGTMEDLKKKFDGEKSRYEKSRDRMDSYTFILVKGEILHIYQGRTE